MRKKPPPHPHDLLFAEVFSRKEVAVSFVKNFAGKELPPGKLRYETFRLEPTSYVKPKLSRVQSDLVFGCQFGKNLVEVCIIKEHKSSRPVAPHFQLLDYIAERWRQEIKQRKKRTPVICILLYHGNQRWNYKPMREYIEGMDDDLARYSPLFEFILVDLDEYSDEFIMGLDTMFLVNTLLLFKHSGDTDYFRANLEKVFLYANQYLSFDEGKQFVETMFVYLTRTTELSAGEIVEIGSKSPVLKESIMKGYTLLDLERDSYKEEFFGQGLEQGLEKGLNKKELIVIRRGWEKGCAPELISDIGEIPLKKVKKVIAQLEAKKQDGRKNGNGKNTA